MNWSFMIVAMMPEHLLLAGIVVLIALDVLDFGAQIRVGGDGCRDCCRPDGRRCWPLSQFEGAPFPGHFSVDQPTLTGESGRAGAGAAAAATVTQRIRR